MSGSLDGIKWFLMPNNKATKGGKKVTADDYGNILFKEFISYC